jgi:AcrR family transcriptional regulator
MNYGIINNQFVSKLEGALSMNDQSLIKKQEIIDKAIEFFSINGIAETKIEDITNALGIGKGTLYLYFKGKKDLLLNCIDRLTTIVIPEEVWLDIREETNYKLRYQKRLVAFLKAYPTFCGILNLVNQSLEGKDPELAKKAGDAYRLLGGPLMKDLKWAIQHGWVREIDVDVIAFIMLGLGEGLGNMLKIDQRYSPEKVAEITWDLMINGIGLSETVKPEKAGSLYWELLDSGNNKIRIYNLCFDDKSFLSGDFGKGELQIPLRSIASLSIQSPGEVSSVAVMTQNNKSIILTVDAKTRLSAETEFGHYEIPLRQVTLITAVPGDEPTERVHE